MNLSVGECMFDYVAVVDDMISGLADLPPGPGLAAALVEIDVSAVRGEHTVDVLRHHARQRAWQEARYLAAVVECGRAVPGWERRPETSEWAVSEIAAALSLTTVGAGRELWFAEMIVTSLPQVHAAMTAGVMDRPKAWVCADVLEDLTAEQRAIICARVLPAAPGLTTSQLRARLQRLVQEIDPGWAERRYRHGLRGGRVVGYLAEDGTMTITATGLPPAEAEAALQRLRQLARRIRRAGHPASVDLLMTELLTGLTDRTLHALSDQQIIDHFLSQARATTNEGAPRTPISEDIAEDAESGDNTDDTDSADNTDSTDNTDNTDSTDDTDNTDNTDDTDSADGGDVGEGVAERSRGQGAHIGQSAADHPGGRHGPDLVGESTGDTAARGSAVGPRTGVEIRVGIPTLLGLSERCGEIAGRGWVLAGEARRLVAAQHRGARWWFAVTGSDGRLVFGGITRRRPIVVLEDQGRCVGGVVEVQISEDLLHRLALDPRVCGPWAPVIADIAAQYAARHRILAGLNEHPDDRFARAALDRHIRLRDRTCCGVGCTRSAHASEIDHTHDHASGGATTDDNLGPCCKKDHGYKTKGWWRLTQPRPGLFRWVSPLGKVYWTRGELFDPPTVAPRPRPDPEQPRPPPKPSTPDNEAD